MKKILSVIAVLTVITACGATVESSTVHTTGAECFSRGTKCMADADCCSNWCASGECSRREP
jgi:hypothetical protein